MSEPTDGWSAPGGSAAPGYGPPSYGPPADPAPGAQGAGWQAPAGWGPQQQGGPPAWGAPRPVEQRPGVIPLRPLGLGELLDGAVQVVRRYPRPTLGLSAIIALASTVLNAIFLYTAFRPLANLDTTSLESGAELDAEIGGAIAGGVASFALTSLATVVLAGVITVVIGKAVLGQPITFTEAWATVRPLVLRLIGLALLINLVIYGLPIAGIAVAVGLGVGLGAGGLFLGVPLAFAGIAAGVYFWPALALAPSVLVLERSTIRTAMSRSTALVKRSWWRVFGILLLAFVIVGIVSNVLQVPFALLGAGGDLFSGDLDVTSLVYVLATAIGAGLAQALVAPFETGVRALLYVDRRMRAEGLDVSLQASAATPPAPGTS